MRPRSPSRRRSAFYQTPLNANRRDFKTWCWALCSSAKREEVFSLDAIRSALVVTAPIRRRRKVRPTSRRRPPSRLQVVLSGVPAPPRWIARYTAARLTQYSSASSSVLCSPPRQSLTRCASCVGLSLGGSRAAGPWPSRRRVLRGCGLGPGPASNSAIIDSTVNSSWPIGSVGSWTEPPTLSRTPRWVSSSTMSRASGTERASRSSFVTTRVSPSRQAARASRSPGRSRFVPVRPWST